MVEEQAEKPLLELLFMADLEEALEDTAELHLVHLILMPHALLQLALVELDLFMEVQLLEWVELHHLQMQVLQLYFWHEPKLAELLGKMEGLLLQQLALAVLPIAMLAERQTLLEQAERVVELLMRLLAAEQVEVFPQLLKHLMEEMERQIHLSTPLLMEVGDLHLQMEQAQLQQQLDQRLA